MLINEHFLQAAKMKLLRGVQGYMKRDLIRNDNEQTELNIHTLTDRTMKQFVSRIGYKSFPRRILDYNPRGKRDVSLITEMVVLNTL